MGRRLEVVFQDVRKLEGEKENERGWDYSC